MVCSCGLHHKVHALSMCRWGSQETCLYGRLRSLLYITDTLPTLILVGQYLNDFYLCIVMHGVEDIVCYLVLRWSDNVGVKGLDTGIYSCYAADIWWMECNIQILPNSFHSMVAPLLLYLRCDVGHYNGTQWCEQSLHVSLWSCFI